MKKKYDKRVDEMIESSILSLEVLSIDGDGFSKAVILDDSDPNHLSKVENAYQKGELTREHLDNIVSVKLKNISSIAFGGIDMKTIYLGCLLGQKVAKFKSNVAGLPPSHWGTVELKNLNYM